MKHKVSKQFLSALLAFVMIVGLIPATTLTVFAAHRCPDCDDLIDGSPYCSECYKCDACVDLCIECGVCTDCSGSEICSGCSDEEIGSNMCLECAYEKGTHCPSCEACFFSVQQWCEECGMCADCVTIDEQCSITHGMILCEDCAAEKGSHCPNCGTCYFEVGGWCEECMLCDDCSPLDQECSSVHGAVLCGECAAERGTHCPECSECYFKVGSWCEECGKCEDCSPACLYCSEEAGMVICEECAIDEGMHCPECSGCYDGGEYCTECGICTACADICSADELCMDCAISGGYHCPSCEECGDQAILCEGCGERCSECADSFCESCNLCSECVLICQGCGSCESCAVICPNCEEYCDQCVGLCDDCEFCLVCCEDIANFEGCDCGEWVCVESADWEAHFAEFHTETEGFHSARPSPTWSFDDTYHWHNCVYCDDSEHVTNKSTHTLGANGVCTVCHYVKDAKIQIIIQPTDSKSSLVTSADEVYDESNIAHFSVKAVGKGELTYTWYAGYYHHSLGTIKYTLLTDPQKGECYEGTELCWLVPTDACYRDWYVRCVITDGYGNEVATRDALVQAKHNYQYFELYNTNQSPCELAERNRYGHVLQCIGEGCEKVNYQHPHEDEDRNGYCDICDYEIGKILVTKQPKDVKNVYSYNPDEGYDESNIAHFRVEAEGESELTYTWCRKQYVGGVLKYVPLKNPQAGEKYDGPELALLVPEDACCTAYTYACIITDEEGNETRTVDVILSARHNYQYYKDYLTERSDSYGDARRKYHGHILVCVSPECGKVTRLRQHVDENHDYFCDICDSQKDIMYVGITVTAPKEGQLPNYNVTSDSVAYFAMGGSSNYTQYRFWFVSDDGVSNWKLIDKSTPFVAGKYYKFVVEMQTKSGYTFPTYNSEPSFWAKVNGDYVMPQKTYGMDPTRYATISYEFGICNDSVIENIIIDNVTEPIAGEKPTYTATVRGSGYYIDTTKNSYYDAYWLNPAEKWYYIKNGIGWFDMTDFDWVYENDTFIPGHEYQIRVFLKTEDGYTFYHANDLTMLFTASVNGTAATGNTTTSWGLTEQTISASFPCQGKEITTVMVNGLSTPKAGETPDYTASVAYPEWYQLDPNYAGTNGIVWYDSDGYQMEPTDTFVAGKKYKMEIKLISATLNGANTSQFTSPVSAYINGKQVVENGIWDAVYASANTVYIYYTFPKEAEYAGVMVSGSVTSFNDANGDITLQLIPEGYSEAAYETVVRGNTVEYKFSHVAAGTYTLKVMKNNHVTREYTVVVGNSSVIQDVKIHLKGDVDGNGTVTTMDFMRANSHARGVTFLTDYALKCADVVGTDGTVTTMDAMRINAHAKGSNLLW